MGFEVLGDNDSPVMPIMLYNPAKIPAFSRECLRQHVSFQNIPHLTNKSCFSFESSSTHNFFTENSAV